MKKPKSIKTFLTPYLRRASLAWSPRNQALSLARTSRGWYKCAMCSDDFKREEVDIDHVHPVVSLKDGFNSWDEYINSLFCPVDGFQILCKSCHSVKTQLEDTMRMQYKGVNPDYEEEVLPELKKKSKKPKK